MVWHRYFFCFGMDFDHTCIYIGTLERVFIIFYLYGTDIQSLYMFWKRMFIISLVWIFSGPQMTVLVLERWHGYLSYFIFMERIFIVCIYVANGCLLFCWYGYFPGPRWRPGVYFLAAQALAILPSLQQSCCEKAALRATRNRLSYVCWKSETELLPVRRNCFSHATCNMHLLVWGLQIVFVQVPRLGQPRCETLVCETE